MSCAVYLEEQLARFVKDPRVTVQVLFNGSIRYYLLGQFVTPGLKYADRAMRLLEGLSLGGSIVLDHASLGSAYVMREGRRLPVNFRRLLRDGDMRQNIWLRGGDTIVVPDNARRAGLRVRRRGRQQFARRPRPVHQRTPGPSAGPRAGGDRLPRAGPGEDVRRPGDSQRGRPRSVLRRGRRPDPAGRRRHVRARPGGHRLRAPVGRDHLERGDPDNPADVAERVGSPQPVRADQVPVAIRIRQNEQSSAGCRGFGRAHDGRDGRRQASGGAAVGASWPWRVACWPSSWW